MKYLVLWILYGIGFLAIEIPAVMSKEPGDTLSELVWAALNLPAMSFLLAGFFAWLIVHFFKKASWK